MAQPLLAIDWGTTSRRVYRVEDGNVTGRAHAPLGASAVEDFAGELVKIRESLGDLPAIVAGMVGSSIGWREAPYVPAPAGLADLARHMLHIDARTMIVPGISFRDGARGDVMRGEEVQLLGAVAGGMAPASAFAVQPGTHSKWARMVDGRIAGFTTAMTGELFGLLRAQGLLATQLTAGVSPGDAFLAGVREGAERDISASLFGIRAAKLLGLRGDADAASFASGILIGAEAAARLAGNTDDRLYILAEPPLGALYAAAVEEQGRSAVVLDSEAAFISGIAHLGALL